MLEQFLLSEGMFLKQALGIIVLTMYGVPQSTLWIIQEFAEEAAVEMLALSLLDVLHSPSESKSEAALDYLHLLQVSSGSSRLKVDSQFMV